MPTYQESELKVGAGAERINPPLGVPLPLAYSNGGEPVAVAGRHDDCWARAIVLEQGETRLAIVAVDICTMRDDQYRAIVARVTARCGIPAEGVLIGCTHNHSNNSLLEPFDASTSPWQETLNDLVVSAVYQACQRLAPTSRIRYATAKFGKVAYNRRVVLPNVCDEVDVVCMLIGAEPRWDTIVERLAGTLGVTRERLGLSREAVAPEGTVDDSLRLLAFEGSGGETLASIVSAACHPVTHSFADRHTCADFPGLLVSQAERELGGMGLFLQGCSGDVRPRYRESSYAEVERVGAEFGSALREAASTLQEIQGPQVIGAMKQQVELPLKPYQPRAQQRTRLAALEEAQRILAQSPPASGADMRERWGIYQESAFLRYQLKWGDLETRQEDLKRESVAATLQALRLGNILLLTSPAEVFAETGIELAAWAAEQGWDGSIVSSCTNGYVNYIPPRAEAERGGFEPSCTMLAPTACALMVDSLKTLGRQVAARTGTGL